MVRLHLNLMILKIFSLSNSRILLFYDSKWLECSHTNRNLGVVVDSKFYMSQHCTLVL